jgi:hypothetical protein
MISCTLNLDTREVSGQPLASAALYLWKEPLIHIELRLVGLRSQSGCSGDPARNQILVTQLVARSVC